MKPHIYAMWGKPLTDEQIASVVDAEIAAGRADNTIREDEVTEARAYLLKATRHQVAIAICADDKGEGPEIARERMILSAWKGAEVKEHRWAYPDAEQLSFTHVVLFEGPPVEGAATDPFFFAGKEIKGAFGLCLYNEPKNAYMHFHCPNCCTLIATEINALQKDWASSATAPKEATHEAPRKLQ